MINEKIKIDGMSCGHCIIAVRKELSRLPLKIKDVSIGSAEIEYDEAKVTSDEIKKAINKAGYSIPDNLQG